MPRLEPLSGDTGHGVGGGNASRNNVAFSPGGFGGWEDPDTAVFVNGATGWTVCRYHKHSDAITQAFDPPLLANDSYAGGGTIAAFMAVPGDERGVYSTLANWPRFLAGRDYQLKDAGLLGVGPDGAIGFKPGYHSNGPSRVRERDGSEWQLTPGHASALQLLGQRRAMWMEGFTVQVAGLPIPAYRNEDGIWAAKAMFVGGEWWIVYYSGRRGVIAHPFTSSDKCYPLVPKGDAWFDITPMGPNLLRFTISRTQGEGVGDIWGYDLNVLNGDATALPYGNQSQAPGQHFDFVPTDSVNPPVIVIPTFRFTHKVMVAVIKDPLNTSGAPVEVLVNQNDQRSSRPLFVAEDTLLSHWNGPLLGIYTEAKGDKLAKVQRTALALKTRVVVVHDSRDPWTLQPGMRSCDIPAPELYRYPGETLVQAHDRWRLDVQAMLRDWPGDCGLVPMYYCMGGIPGGIPPEVWPVADVLDTQRFLSEMTNKSDRIKVLLPFSYLRGNGITAHVEFQQSFVNLLAAAPEMPELLPVPIPPVDPEPTTPYPEARPYETRTV